VAEQLPLFEPASAWSVPEVLPDLSAAPWIGLDTETYDPNLEERGPGGSRGRDGHLLGVSLACPWGRWYLPLRHPCGQNLPLDLVLRYLRTTLSNPAQPKIGANLLYECDWLGAHDVEIAGPLYDVQVAEALLDENKRSYSLENVAKEHVGQGKEYGAIIDAVLAFCGERASRNPRKHLWRLPARHVGPYAEWDASLPADVFAVQERLLREQGLWDLFLLETRNLHHLARMRRVGVRVDVARAEQLDGDLGAKQRELQEDLDRRIGLRIEVWAQDSIAKAFDQESLSYPRSPTGLPSFKEDFLKDHPHWLPQRVLEIRKLDRVRGTFIRGFVMGAAVNGRIHCSFHPLRSDEGGAATGRFSSSNPNLQQIPARTDVGKLVRTLFIPEEGCRWLAADYSQQEPRLAVHFGAVRGFPGALELRERYVRDPATDFHDMMAQLTGLPRKACKSLSLGILYGMGAAKLAKSLGVSDEEGKRLLETFHQRASFMKDLTADVARVAERRGFVRTLLGRRRRFDAWEPAGWDRRGVPIRGRDAAVEQYGENVRRSMTHKALNAVVQGSAADMGKSALDQLATAGYLPHVLVHDENGLSVESGKQVAEVTEIMRDALPVSVPMRVDTEVGPSWGEAR
jgi:DNA polymerase I-like protein with 3'-5' exonuclease and polymerase domains